MPPKLISTGFVESAVNEIVSKRMVKKQQRNRHTVQSSLDVRRKMRSAIDIKLSGQLRRGHKVAAPA